jgi:hypothetical protein
LDSIRRSAAINSWLQHVTVVNRKRSVATPFHSHFRHDHIRVTRNLILCALNPDSAIFGISRISGKSQIPKSAISGAADLFKPNFGSVIISILSVAQVIPFAATT